MNETCIENISSRVLTELVNKGVCGAVELGVGIQNIKSLIATDVLCNPALMLE